MFTVGAKGFRGLDKISGGGQLFIVHTGGASHLLLSKKDGPKEKFIVSR